MEEISPRSRAAIEATLAEDIDDERSPRVSIRRRYFLRSLRQRHNYLSSDSETEVLLETSLSSTSASGTSLSDDESSQSFQLTVEGTSGQNASTSRYHGYATRPIREGIGRTNKVTRSKRECRHKSPALVTLDDSLPDEEPISGRRLRSAQEEADYQFALKLSAELNKSEGITSGNSNFMQDVNESSFDDQQCIICFEKPQDPVACIYCRQMVGCRSCIMKWRNSTNKNSRDRSPLSRGISSANHKSCPLCRVEWYDIPEVVPWEDIFPQYLAGKNG